MKKAETKTAPAKYDGTWTVGLSEFEFQKLKPTDGDKDQPQKQQQQQEEMKLTKLPSDHDLAPMLEKAKKYIQTVNKKTGYNLYDHVAKILIYLLDHRPNNAVNIVEDISQEVSQRKPTLTEDEILQKKDNQVQLATAAIHKKLFEFAQGLEGPPEEEPEEPTANRNVMESAFYFQQLDVGLEPNKLFCIVLAIRKLISEKGLQHARFWGKILGLEQDYYVVEADFVEGDEEDEEEEAEEEQQQQEEVEQDQQEQEENEDPLPKIKYKKAKEVPKEEAGTGTNKKMYFVSNDPGKIWIRLPMVTPQQIYVAKRIKKFFTGRLDAPVISYPTFPGVEKNYLRAQLSRISAATLIAPSGFYLADEEAADEDGNITSIVPDTEYQPLELQQLGDPSMDGWVHTEQYILPQGRCKWWNQFEDEEEEEEEDEDAEKDFSNPRKSKINATPQIGPPILNKLREDSSVYGQIPWSIQVTSPLMPEHAFVGVHSMLWPGAHAYSVGKKYDNIYIGWGHKFNPNNYSPPLPFKLAREYPEIAEIHESLDPSGEDELAAKTRLEEEEKEDEELESRVDDDD